MKNVIRKDRDGSCTLDLFFRLVCPYEMIPDISQCSYSFHTYFLVELGNDCLWSCKTL